MSFSTSSLRIGESHAHAQRKFLSLEYMEILKVNPYLSKHEPVLGI